MSYRTRRTPTNICGKSAVLRLSPTKPTVRCGVRMHQYTGISHKRIVDISAWCKIRSLGGGGGLGVLLEGVLQHVPGGTGAYSLPRLCPRLLLRHLPCPRPRAQRSRLPPTPLTTPLSPPLSLPLSLPLCLHMLWQLSITSAYLPKKRLHVSRCRTGRRLPATLLQHTQLLKQLTRCTRSAKRDGV